VARVNLQQTFRLQAHEVARYQLADGAQLMRQILVRSGQLAFDAVLGALAPFSARRTSAATSRWRTVAKESSSIMPTTVAAAPRPRRAS